MVASFKLKPEEIKHLNHAWRGLASVNFRFDPLGKG
jgi:hypothetical protein